MNTAQLKSRFGEIYTNFYGKSRLILSMPFITKWSGDLNAKHNGLFIRQKVPLRIYIWANPNQEHTIRFRSISYYDMYEDRFISTELLEYLPHLHDVERFINQEFGDYLKKEWGHDLYVLTELSRGAGLGFEGIFSQLIAATIQTIRWDFVPTDVKNMENSNINEMLHDASAPAAKVMNLGTRIEQYLRNGTSSFWGYAAALFDSKYPIVSFSEDTGPLLPGDHSKKKIFTFRYNELFDWLSPLPHLPIDFGVIYSGKPAMIDQIQQAYINDKTWIPKVHALCKNTFEKYLKQEIPAKRPRFFKDYVENEFEGLDGSFGRISGAISLEIFYSLALLYMGGYKESNIRNFIQAIDKHRYSDYITQKVSIHFKGFINEFIKNFWLADRLLGIIPNYTMIMGGSVTFMVPIEGFRQWVMWSLSETRKNYPDARLIYCSWQDGNESNGIIFEQSVEHWLYSDFIKQNSVLLECSDGTFEFGYFDGLLKTPHLDIIFDTVNTRVYIEWERLTSKDLHSQGTTIEVFSLLLEHVNHEVSNKKLPISSYSLNKNEMQWKIIQPLTRTLRAKTGKELPVSISGNINDFTMKLLESPIKIWILKKL